MDRIRGPQAVQPESTARPKQPHARDARVPALRDATTASRNAHSPHHYCWYRRLKTSFQGRLGGSALRVTCLQESLARGLQITGRAVSTRGSLPILGNVLLRTEGGRLKLTATNLEVGINCWVPAKVDDEGAITVPAKLFTDFVNQLPPGPTELSLNVRTKTVHLRRDPYEANFKGMDAEEFPIIPVAPDRPTTRVSKSTLRRMIGEVAFVATTDDSRPVLTGVLTTLESDKITMAADDPYRLSVRNAKLMDRVEGKLEVIIPARSLQEVQRVLDDSEDPVDIFVTPNGSQVIFHTPEVDLVSRVIEGQFPNYRQVIPQGKQATRLASLFARDSANMLRFQVNPADHPPLVISANAAEVGDQTAKVEATVEGQNTTIAFNSRFIYDALGSLTASAVALELGGPLA